MRYIAYGLLLLSLNASAQPATFQKFDMPDTLKAAQFYTGISVKSTANGFYGNSFSKGRIGLNKKRKSKTFLFTLDSISANTQIVATGLNVRQAGRQSVSWKYNWQKDQPYKLLVTTLTDSATRASFFTGYVFLPEEKQWKLIASFKTTDGAKFLKNPAAIIKSKKTFDESMSVQEAWIQRSNGSWKNMLTSNTAAKPPVFSVTNHIDSSAQVSIDKTQILQAKTDTTATAEGVYYSMIQEGKGDYVKLTDTVSVYYKGWLLKDGTIFDQTKDKPAKFPLARLIKGWQLGVVHCRVGGRIRIVIPSGLAYSIRSRSKDIPPNSVLVFEVEVLEVKAAG